MLLPVIGSSEDLVADLNHLRLLRPATQVGSEGYDVFASYDCRVGALIVRAMPAFVREAKRKAFRRRGNRDFQLDTEDVE
jgi:hypothetical protein